MPLTFAKWRKKEQRGRKIHLQKGERKSGSVCVCEERMRMGKESAGLSSVDREEENHLQKGEKRKVGTRSFRDEIAAHRREVEREQELHRMSSGLSSKCVDGFLSSRGRRR